ncbi:hypothetical protein ID866_1902 [Astraeus odoratus]|nr:hypothetical protein ID866_1902 [Astraeus odoratus]
MDVNQQHSHISHSTNSSSSSAVDLTGIGLSVPQSPTSDANRARRRTSWSKPDAGLDHLHLELPPTESGTSSRGINSLTLRESLNAFPLDDPFYSPIEPPYSIRGKYCLSAHSEIDSSRDDDREHLTTKKTSPLPGDTTQWLGDYTLDSERVGGATPRTRRRTVARLSGTPSPLQRTGTAIKSAFRRASMRVANVRAHDTSIRLPDDDDDDDELYSDADSTPSDKTNNREGQLDPPRGVQQTTPLRGYALGFLGPMNPFRLKLYLILSHPYSEPVILALILATAVVLVVQASRTVVLSSNQTVPSPQKGYFHTWEDYALFVFYILFTWVLPIHFVASANSL